jgi:hypothetical protein
MDSNKAPDISDWPRVTEVLKATGIADFASIPNIEFYLQRGQDVHMICESIVKGEPDYWTGTELEGYAIAFQSFLADTKFRPDLVEHPVYHETRRYKGTLDLTGRMGDNDHPWLIDLKSGIVAEWVKLQTAAYASCLPSPDRIKRAGVQLKKTGKYVLSPEYKDYRTDSNYFFSLVATVHGRTLYGKTAVED